MHDSDAVVRLMRFTWWAIGILLLVAYLSTWVVVGLNTRRISANAELLDRNYERISRLVESNNDMKIRLDRIERELERIRK